MDTVGAIIVLTSVALGGGACYWLFTRKPARKDELHFFEKPYGIKFANREQIKANYDELERKGKLAAEARQNESQVELQQEVIKTAKTSSSRLEVLSDLEQEPRRIFSVKIETVETPRPQKDASFEFNVLGSTCTVKYFSDWKYLLTITDPDEYHYDPRRWVDVHYKEGRYGYAWNEGYWTHSASNLPEREQIEYTICQHFGTLLPALTAGTIQTIDRQSLDKKYLIRGRADNLVINAQFRHAGFVLELDIAGYKGRYDTRNGTLSAPARAKPAEGAIIEWLLNEYNILRPLKGALPNLPEEGKENI